MTYLITGVTGGLGGSILEHLSKQIDNKDIAVLVRSEDKGKIFADKGYDVRIGDYSNVDLLEKAFDGIETLMFVSGTPGQNVSREQQHINVIEAAKKAGVKNIVYTSIAKGLDSTAVLAPDHIVTEKLLATTDFNYKILRNNWYIENELESVKGVIAGQGFIYGAGDGRTGWALRREYAEAAANALTQSFTGQEVYELSGKPITYSDFAKAVKEATNLEFPVTSLDIEDFKKLLEDASLPESAVTILTAIQSDIRNGQLDVDSNDLEKFLGHPQTPLVEAIKELLQ